MQSRPLDRPHGRGKSQLMPRPDVLIGVDVGGTFTDAVVVIGKR
jgi:hypothetical protein